MINKKRTKRALLVSALAIVMCLTMLIGSTFAWFTDSVTSGRNVIKSGNLDIQLEIGTLKDGIDANGSADPANWDWAPVDSSTKIFNDAALFEPGHVQTVALRVTNAGSLALKYNFAATVYSEKTAVNTYGDTFKLSDYLTVLSAPLVYAKYDRDLLYSFADGSIATENLGVTVGKLNETMFKDVVMNPGESKAIALAIVMPTTVDNVANHNGVAPEIQLGINLVATQYTKEADSFDNQYDKDATYPALVSNSAELKDALTNADVHDIVFVNDVTLDEAVNVTTDKVINFNGNDFTATSGSRPFQVYGADITINATGSNVALDKYGLIDIREGADVKISIIGGTFNGELDNGAVIKGRASTKAEIYLKDVNMSFTDSSTNGSYVYNPVSDGIKSASAATIIDGGVYNIDCGLIGDVVMKNATVNAKGFIFNGGGSIENSILTTDGSSKAPFGAAPFCCVAASNGKTVTVKNSTLTATNCNAIEVYPTGGTVTVVGSTVNGTCYKHAADANHQGAVISITIDGVEQ